MESDLETQFSQVFKNNDFARTLHELSSHTSPREKARVWAHRLRFLCPSIPQSDVASVLSGLALSESSETCSSCQCDDWLDFSDWPTTPSPRISLTEPGELGDCIHYVAVSYCWQSSNNKTGGTEPPLTVLRSSGQGPPIAPAEIIQRAISYASEHTIPLIWIDQECIFQSDREDKENGIQAMDLVYQRAEAVVGLLNTSFDKQEELDLLDHLVCGEDIAEDEMSTLLDVLEKFKEDRWFYRAWILQESTSAGGTMDLLAKHAPNLTKTDYFGEIPGEVILNVDQFHNMMFWAWECVRSSADALDDTLSKRLKETIDGLIAFLPNSMTNFMKSEKDAESRSITCNAAQALSFLQNRKNSRVADRIAILGNLCDYSIRLDTHLASRYTLTQCLFALSIINGDLSLCRSDIRQISDRLSFSWGPPKHLTIREVEYLDNDDMIALKPASVTPQGLVIEGNLWEIHRIDLPDIQRQYSDCLVQVREVDIIPPPIYWQRNRDRVYHGSEYRPGRRREGYYIRAEVTWCLIKELLRRGFQQLADLAWKTTFHAIFRNHEEGFPSEITEVVDIDTLEYIPTAPSFIKDEVFIREAKDTPEYTWRGREWLATSIMKNGYLSVGRLAEMDEGLPATADQYNALFNVEDKSTRQSVFTASGGTQPQILVPPHQFRPLAWRVDIKKMGDQHSKSVDQVLKVEEFIWQGAWYLPQGAQSRHFILA